MRMPWTVWAITLSICGYLLSICFSALLLTDIRLPGGRSRSLGERGSGQHEWKTDTRKLAVIVPTHDGDVDRAFLNMKNWPSTCSSITLSHVDLILYHATTADATMLRDGIPEEATACFRDTKVVCANLTPEEDVYPIGPSLQFYRMYLDEEVVEQLSEYDALAIIEWDVVVAHESSFHRLHEAAFANSEPFWVKGSTLAGTEFHETAVVSDQWFILGHLNGNAIYNNSDPAFSEFIDYTLKRWQYSYPYDVALWASLADFPYSWPLWQRYSQKFVATNLISNVGFHDVGNKAVLDAVAADTLFIHGSTSGGGSTTWMGASAERHTDEGENSAGVCTQACENEGRKALRRVLDISTVCDPTCVSGEDGLGPRFGGHLCGVYDPAKFGSMCRTCYTDQLAALAVDQQLEANLTTAGKHVIMCDTKRPAQAIDCSAACAKQEDTICDQRCGSGHHGDLHCNWREMGSTCRFCFNDPLAARLADAIAMTRGERVIMCDTHEPPASSMLGDAEQILSEDVSLGNGDREHPGDDFSGNYENGNPGDTIFTEDIKHSQLCAFMPGYFEFLGESELTVLSVLHFMPGIQMVIPTSFMDFHVFNKTMGHLKGVKVANSTHVDIAALVADELCEKGTRLIYYMNPGQIITRAFSSKDTHTLAGDLTVIYTGVDKIGRENAVRAMATTSLLGYHAPSFTYGTDLILPADVNNQLRRILLSAAAAEDHGTQDDEDEIEFEVIREYMMAMSSSYDLHTKSFIPEVLAATAYYHNEPGTVFLNPIEWSQHHLFESVSVWDVPLVKPHFSCMVDLRLSLQGFDVARALQEWLQAFRKGARCERGFVALDRLALMPKPNIEFGEAVGKPMPNIGDYKISVMYRSFYGDADLFKVSIPTVMKHFPTAHELVVVVEERDGDLFRELLAPHEGTSPFPLRVVTEPSLMDGHIQQKYSKECSSLVNLDGEFLVNIITLAKLRGDLYCSGDYILHLDSDSVIFETVTYDHIFHLGKPVLPYRRYREELSSGKHLSWCWRNGTSLAVGEDVVHEYSIFNTHVYPRKMYSAIRKFVEERHNSSFADFMSTRRGKCMTVKTLSGWTFEERNLLLSDFNLMGAYLWYHMHDAVHWMATDPLDQTPTEWRRDVTRYSWVCQANARHMPTDKAGQAQYIEMLTSVTSFDECVSFQESFTPRII